MANSPLEASLWLKEAIAMEQALLRKIMEKADDIQLLPDLLDLLEVTTKAHTRLAGLLRAQKMLGESTSDLDTAISNALLAAQQDFGIM